MSAQLPVAHGQLSRLKWMMLVRSSDLVAFGRQLSRLRLTPSTSADGVPRFDPSGRTVPQSWGAQEIYHD